MKSFVSILCIITIICFGCNKEKNSEENEKDLMTEQLDSLSDEKVNIDIIKLSPQATKDLESFEDFKNLRNLMQSLNKSNPFLIRKYSDSIHELIDIFNENLSEDLNVNTINSRTAVLLTESGLLNQLIESKDPNSQKLMNANIRLLTAYNSLIIQLNELSLAIPENIEKELLRERDLLRDSITDTDASSLQKKK